MNTKYRLKPYRTGWIIQRRTAWSPVWTTLTHWNTWDIFPLDNYSGFGNKENALSTLQKVILKTGMSKYCELSYKRSCCKHAKQATVNIPPWPK